MRNPPSFVQQFIFGAFILALTAYASSLNAGAMRSNLGEGTRFVRPLSFQDNTVRDTTGLEGVGSMEDTIDTTIATDLDESDSLDASLDEEVPDTRWRIQAKSNISSLNARQGVDLSASAPTLDLGLKLSHDIGAYLSVSRTNRLGSQAMYQQTTAMFGYMYSVNDDIDLSADLSYFDYPNDSINVFAGSPLALSFGIDIAGKVLDYSLSIDHYFGNPSSNYLNLGLSHTFVLGDDEDFSIIPSLGLSLGSTKYKLKKLKTEKNVKGLNAVTLDVYLNYRLGSGFSISADPTILISFQRDLLKVLRGNLNATSKVAQLLMVAGIRYSYSF